MQSGFCAAISTIASAGDSILVPVPWYFNHEMWLTLQGINIIPIPCDKNMLPDIGTAKKLIDKKTKAIVMVTPLIIQLALNIPRICRENLAI